MTQCSKFSSLLLVKVACRWLILINFFNALLFINVHGLEICADMSFPMVLSSILVCLPCLLMNLHLTGRVRGLWYLVKDFQKLKYNMEGSTIFYFSFYNIFCISIIFLNPMLVVLFMVCSPVD